MNSITEMRGKLRSIGANVSEQWLQSMINRKPSKLDDLITVFINNDIFNSSVASLPPYIETIDDSMLAGPCILQIEELVNIGTSEKTRQKSDANRLLKLFLSDGKQKAIGIELSKITALSFATPVGSKILLSNVPIKRGVLLLTPWNCKFLGGKTIDRSNVVIDRMDIPPALPPTAINEVGPEIPRRNDPPPPVAPPHVPSFVTSDEAMVTDENDFPARRTLQANVPSSGWLASSAKPPSIQRHTKPAVLPYIPPPFAPTTAPNPLPLIPYTTAAVSESNQKNLVLSPGADIGRPAVCEDEAKDADSQMILTQDDLLPPPPHLLPPSTHKPFASALDLSSTSVSSVDSHPTLPIYTSDVKVKEEFKLRPETWASLKERAAKQPGVAVTGKIDGRLVVIKSFKAKSSSFKVECLFADNSGESQRCTLCNAICEEVFGLTAGDYHRTIPDHQKDTKRDELLNRFKGFEGICTLELLYKGEKLECTLWKREIVYEVI